MGILSNFFRVYWYTTTPPWPTLSSVNSKTTPPVGMQGKMKVNLHRDLGSTQNPPAHKVWNGAGIFQPLEVWNDVHRTHDKLVCSQPSIFSCFPSIVERGERVASELDASARREASRVLHARLSHKLLGNFSATFVIFGNFCDFRQFLKFLATFDFIKHFLLIYFFYFFRNIY